MPEFCLGVLEFVEFVEFVGFIEFVGPVKFDSLLPDGNFTG
jgi:hypothetical protein